MPMISPRFLPLTIWTLLDVGEFEHEPRDTGLIFSRRGISTLARKKFEYSEASWESGRSVSINYPHDVAMFAASVGDLCLSAEGHPREKYTL